MIPLFKQTETIGANRFILLIMEGIMKEQDVLRESELILQSLLEITSNEQSALINVEEETLSEIVSQKNQLLDSLSKYQTRLSRILEKDTGEKTEEIRRLLNECRKLNMQNRKVGHMGLNVINKSFEILQNAMHIASVKTYGPKGMKTAGSRKRHLGVV